MDELTSTENPTLDYDALLNEASTITGVSATPKPRKKKPAVDPRVQTILDRMRGGESKQESTGNTGAINPDSGAIGEFQVMPYNVPKWTEKHYKQRLSLDQFRTNPEAQTAVFNGEMGNYIRKALPRAKGNEDVAMRMAAAAWYGGEGAMHRYDDPTPMFYKGRRYPSFQEYTSKVLNKAKSGATFDYADLLKQADAIVGPTQQPPDYQDLINQASAITQPQPATPRSLAETQPAEINPLPQTAPIPEAPQTLSAQATSMLDAKSPRSAILVTPGEQLPLLGNSSGVTTVKLPEGTLIVNHKKLGIKPSDVPAYVKKNGFAGLIGKVQDVGNNTATGPALVTKDANGNELSSSIVTSPQSAALQAQTDKAQFPQTASQEIKPAENVVQNRIATLGGVQENPQPPVENAPASVTPAKPNVPVTLPPTPEVSSQEVTPAVPTNVKSQTFDPKAFHTANAYLVSQGQKPLTKEEFLSTIGSFGSNVETSINPSDFSVNGQPVTSPELARGETVGKGTLTMERTAGKQTDDLSGIAGTYTPSAAKDDKDAYRQAVLAAGSKYGITPQEVDQYVAKKQGPLWKQAGNWQPGDQILVPLSVLAEVGGSKVRDQYRLEQGQNIDKPLDLSAQTKATFTGDDIRNTLGTVGETVGQTFGLSGIGQELGEDTAGFIQHLNSSLGGGTAKLLLGIGRFVNDLSPTKGESLAQARGDVPEVGSIQQALQQTYQGTDEIVRTNGKDGTTSWVFNTAGDLVGAAPRFVVLSALPGGAISAMAIDMGGQTYGSGSDVKTALKETGKGAAFGALFKFVPGMAKPAGIVGEGVTLGRIGVGTYAASRVFGSTPEQALHDAVMNAGFHVVGVLQEKALSKFAKKPIVVRAQNGEGQVLTAEVRPDGDVVSVAPETPADVEVHVPGPNREQRRATTEVPETPAEPEKTQYTSQLDEIRQNNARTTREVQALFPEAKLSREEASELRRQAWGDEDLSKQQNEAKVPQPAASVDAENSVPTPETQAPKTVSHPNPAIDGKEIVATREDGKVVVPNESNKSGVSIVTNREAEKGFEITEQTGPQATTAVGRLKEQRDTARREADTDPLTGIANRRALDRALPNAEKDPNTSVVSFDANNFGQINKKLGETEGDKALIDIANAFKQAAEESKTGARVFRRGGDEFVMLVPKEKAEAIRSRAEELYGEKKYGETTVSVTGTIGNNFSEANSLLQAAKAERKNRATMPSDGSEITQPVSTRDNQGESPVPEQGASFGTEERGRQTASETESANTRSAKTASIKSEAIKPTGRVYTERGTEAEIETRTIPRSQILTSLDEGYPQELQPRDRSRAASRDQINEISGKLNPELLGDSPKASDGRPLVIPVEIDGGTKYAVVSGNGRSEAIRNASGEPSKAYDDFVQSKGGNAGDMYVGVLGPKTDLEMFAREANESSTAKMSATEQAQADSKDLDLSNFTPSDDGSIHTGANREFIRNFVGKLPASERGEMMLPDGTLSQTGANRIRNAVFAKAYGGTETGLAVIQRMAESTDNNVKRITSALLQNAPGFADLKAGIESGSRYPGLDITGDLSKAVEKFSFLRENGDSVDEFLKQQNMFGDELTDFQKWLLQVVDAKKNSAKALSTVLNNYIRIANEAGDPNQQSIFESGGDKTAPTLFKEAVLQYEAGNELKQQRSEDLFSTPDAGSSQRSSGGETRESDVPTPPQKTEGESIGRRSEVSTSEPRQTNPKLKPGDTVTNEGRVGKVYERGGELRVKFERDGQTKSTRLTDEWTKSANPEAGAASADLLTLGLTRTIKEDVGPGAKEAARLVKDSVDDIRGAVFASGRGQAAKLTSGELRKNLAEMARSYDVAQHALKAARNYFSRNPIEDNHDFISQIESGNIKDLPPTEQPFATELRRLLDESRDRVRSLGTGKLENFIENYFPHIWKDPKKATDVFASIMAKRPFEGGKSFLKKRSINTFKEGLDAGLEPISDNPVDLALLKIREMDRYIAAHRTLQYLKENGLAEFVPVGEARPKGFARIDDKIGEVFLPPTMVKPEYVDTTLYEGLQKLAQDLGIKHERLESAGRSRIGYSVQGGDRIVTQFATGERVFAHEISHQLDHKYGFADRFLKNPDRKLSGPLRAELRKLADSKQATLDNPEGSKRSYTRKRAEQMAHILEGYVNDRAAFEEKYPTVSKVFNQIIDENPELEQIRKLQRSLGKTELRTELSRGGITKIGDYYAAEPAARIINNHLSPGLQGNSAYRAWRYAGNLMNQFQLGFSAFHAAFTTFDAITSKLALAVEQAASGRPIKAVKSTAELPVSWLTNLIRGDKVFREWLTPESTDPQTQEMVKLMVEAGGRAKMDDFYHTRAATKMLDAFKRGNVLGGVFRLPTGAIDLISRPVMEWLVPRQKLGVFADLTQWEVERLGKDATDQQKREAMQRAWDSVDNRMGQLVYDNLFWNKMIKDVAMASVRSVGWNLGSIREMGGGIKDTIALPLRVRRAFKEGKAVEPIVTHRMAYIAALPVVTAIVGGLTQYLLTGKGPDEMKDYFFPKTGNFDENGRPERLSLPTYMRDVYAYTRHPGRTAGHKLHPLIGTVAEMLENKDYYGTEIRNSDDPIMQQVLDELKFAGKNFTPFAVQGLSKEMERKGSTSSKILPFFGFTPAPKDVNTTKAEDLLSEVQAQHREVGSRTKAEAERSHLLSDLVRAKKRGEDYKTDLRNAIEAGILKRSDAELVVKRASTDYLSYGVRKLPIDDALKIYEVADEQERDRLKKIMKIKVMNAAKKGSLNKELKEKLRSFGLLRQTALPTDSITNQ
jgi:diguanylate cyclase (GGDEF)-like protein